jgi:CheY-like chemotaxis protein
VHSSYYALLRIPVGPPHPAYRLGTSGTWFDGFHRSTICIMPLSALLLSEDAKVIRTLRPMLPEFGIHTDQCTSPESSRKLLNTQKYEAIIVDTDSPGAMDFLASMRQLPMTRHAIIFALTSSIPVTSAFKAGANFVLEKPLAMDKAMRSFRAAQGLILRERRRYFRHAVSLFATFDYGSSSDAVSITNLSLGGMAIECSTIFTPGLTMKWKFELPEGKGIIEGKGEVSWADNTGHAGICFLLVPLPYKLRLESWLSERSLDEPLPLYLNVNQSWNQGV